MSDVAFISLTASTVLTDDARPRPNGSRGSIGLAVIEGQLCVSIAEEGGPRVMVARLHETVLDDFAECLPTILPKFRLRPRPPFKRSRKNGPRCSDGCRHDPRRTV